MEKGEEREKLSGCLSPSQQPGECDGQMDKCNFRLPRRQSAVRFEALIRAEPFSHKQ